MKKFGKYEMYDNPEKDIPKVWDWDDVQNVLLDEFKYWCNFHPYDRLRSKVGTIIKFSRLRETEWYLNYQWGYHCELCDTSCPLFDINYHQKLSHRTTCCKKIDEMISEGLINNLKPPFRVSLLHDGWYLIYDPKTKNKPRKRKPKSLKKRNPLTKSIRHEVFKRDGYRCLECGATNKETRLHIDHIIPVAQGGSDELSNLQTLCRDCNLAKSNRAWKGGVV